MAGFFDDMSDEQVGHMVNTLSSLRLVGLIGSLKPEQIERALPLIKSEKQRQLIQELLTEHNQGK
jgi:Mg/Co/Ni transporter MgtE